MLHSWCVMLWCPRISNLCLHFLFHTSLLPPCLSPSFLRSVLPSFLPNFLHTSNSLSLFPILPFSLPLPLSFPRSLSPSRLPPSSDHYTVEVPLPRLAFQMLPHEIKEGKALQVYPVLFNVGINEQQTIADRYRNTFLFYRRIKSSTLVTNVHLFSYSWLSDILTKVEVQSTSLYRSLSFFCYTLWERKHLFWMRWCCL